MNSRSGTTGGSGNNTIVVLGNNLDHLILIKPLCDVLKAQKFEIVYIAADTWRSTFGFIDRLGYDHIRSVVSEDVIFDKGLWDGNVLSHLRNCNPSWVFWWNGSTFPARNWRSLIKSAYRTLFFEVGYCPQREHLFIDPDGVNYASSFIARPEESLEPSEARTIDEYIVNYISRQNLHHGPPGDFIFVPLQLENDTQIELYSPWFKAMQDFIDFVCSSFPGHEIVIKQHPLDSSNYKVPPHQSVTLVKKGSLYDYISRCSAVVGINSTVCTEALLLGKPVATCGYGIFSNRGVTLECVDRLEEVKQVTSFRPEREKIRKYLFNLVFRGQIRVGSAQGTIVTSELRDISQLCHNEFLARVVDSRSNVAYGHGNSARRPRRCNLSRLWMPLAMSLYKIKMKCRGYVAPGGGRS